MNHTGAKIVIPTPTATEMTSSAQAKISVLLISHTPSDVC